MKNICMMLAQFSALVLIAGCGEREKTSDDVQRDQQERILAEGTSQVGMPAIKNFREKKILKDILEMRDQRGLITYTYMENLTPLVVPGYTARGGKLTYLGESIGYALPAATQFTNPQKVESYWHTGGNYQWVALPQADPNGLFSPASAEGSWIQMRNPKNGKVEPQYSESRLSVFTYKLEFDQAIPSPAEASPAVNTK